LSSRTSVRAFISETFFVDEYQDIDSFLQTGIIDSMGMLELVAFLERTYNLKIPDDELVPENLDSVDSICGFLARKQVQAA
jgi:acyl carrier protein